MNFVIADSGVRAKMKVVGVGGAGGNAVNRMVTAGLKGVEFIAINTDHQVLEPSLADKKVQIGNNVTRGLGVGAKPDVGRQAIEEDRDQVADGLADTDLVFVTAGMGGGTGTGASPVVAEIARHLGALTIGIVTLPFVCEGKTRMRYAHDGIANLKEKVDTLIAIPNEKLLSITAKDTPLQEAFRMADDVLLQATKGISDLIAYSGIINLDFSDVKTVMSEGGDALMGTGCAGGETRAEEAAERAIKNPLLEDVSIEGAKAVLVNISGSSNLTLHETTAATMVINEAVGDDAEIILGAVIDEALGDEVRVTVIATGFNKTENKDRSAEVQIGDLPHQRSRSMELPTYIRKSRQALELEQENEKVVEEEAANDLDLDKLDYPTFMRKKMV